MSQFEYSNEGHAADNTFEAQGYVVDTLGRARYKVENDLAQLNSRYPAGTPVCYWRGGLGIDGKQGKIRAPFEERNNVVVGWIEGCAGYVAITHIAPGRIKE